MKWAQRLMACAVLFVTGCGLFSKPPLPDVSIKETAVEGTKGMVTRLTETVFVQDYTVLNVIAGLASFIAFGAVIARAFGFPIPNRAVGTAVACAVGAWLLRLILVKYLWLIALLAIFALIAGAAGFAYGHRKWLELRLGIDIDRDGKIGE